MMEGDRSFIKPGFLLPIGTQVVTRVEMRDPSGRSVYPKGSVGEIVNAEGTDRPLYRVRFPDGGLAAYRRGELSIRKRQLEMALQSHAREAPDLYQYVIYRCLVGSRAYGLARADSDEDRRGIYLPPADLHWSLFGVPEQLEDQEAELCYWELQKFVNLALKGNPNILECLYTPLIEYVASLARELLDMRQSFLSKTIFQTYNGYAMSQFKKMEQSLKRIGTFKGKHAMHLIRLLICGIQAMKEKTIIVDVGTHRDRLLAIRSGEMPWKEIDAWRLELHEEFARAFEKTELPELPDYSGANAFLIKARRAMI